MSYGVAALGYLFLASLGFQSIVANLSTAIPGIKGGNPDFALFYWDLWWFQHAILRLGQDPFYTNYILFPHTLNLAYHTLAPFLGLIAIPISAAMNWPATMNILLIGSLVFSGVALFAFLHHHGVSSSLAFVGGAVYAFNSFSTLQMSVLHLNMIPMGWLPAGLLASDWVMERRTWQSAIVLGLMIYAAVMTDQLFAIWLPLLVLPYLLYRFACAEAATRRQVGVLGVLALAVLLGLLAIAPLPAWLAGRNVQYPLASLRTAQARSMQLSDIIALPPRFEDSERGTLGLLLPIGVAASLMVGKGMRDRIFWLMVGLAGLILALGPTLQPIGLPLPYQLIHLATGGLFRIPGRFVLLAILGMIIFAAFSLQSLYARFHRVGRWSFVIGALMFLAVENQWYVPFPVFSMPDYRIYHDIGRDPDEYLILEVPVGPDNAIADRFGHGVELQYYATVHRKRLINGDISRAAIGITSSYRQWPLIAALAEEGSLPDGASAHREFEQLSAEWDIRYVILHRELLSQDTANWAVAFFNTQPNWCLVDEEETLLAYQLSKNGLCPTDLLMLPTDGTIHLGNSGADRYLGPGWYPSENIGGPPARWTGAQPSAILRVHLARQAYRLILHATSYLPDQKITISLNNRHVADLSIGEGWAEYRVEMPAEVIPTDGWSTFTLAFSRSASAFERTNGQSEDRRPLAVAYDAITFAPVPPVP